MGRIITIDLDFKDTKKLIKKIKLTLHTVKKLTKIIVKKSSSGNYHLIIWTNKDYKDSYVYRLRKKLGDDESRIRHDKVRKIGHETLFDKKIKLK